MQDSDFIKLLKSHTECLLDEKKFRGLLNDLFPTEVQMNNILVNLYHLGLPKELEESESINDSVYFKYKKSVVKVYGIDQKLADTAIRLWLFCYGENVLGREIKISVAVPHVSDEGQQGEYNDSGTKSTDFSQVNNAGDDGFAFSDVDIKIPKIEEYKKAVLREKYFIQNEGGRKYKVTNGNLISSSQGYSTYSFEMESELNLSDDAPISLSVGSDVAKGSVIVCEGFQIIIVVDRDFGAKISQAFIGVEPWKLLEALVNKL